MKKTHNKSEKDTRDVSADTENDYSGTQSKEYAGNRRSEARQTNPGEVTRLRGLKSDANAKTTGVDSDNRF